jgi:hypothetical protein
MSTKEEAKQKPVAEDDDADDGENQGGAKGLSKA